MLGPSGSGKTTFINTLCETSVIPPKDYSSPDLAAAERTVSITAHTVGAFSYVVLAVEKRRESLTQ